MRKTFLVILAVMLIGSFAFAEGAPRAGEFGIQGALIFTTLGFGPVGDVGAKYFINDTMAIRVGLGIVNTSSGGTSQTLYDLGAGFEYHLGGKGGVSPYVGAELSYGGESLSAGGTTPSVFGLAAVFGGEYFFSSNFSWAGEIGRAHV